MNNRLQLRLKIDPEFRDLIRPLSHEERLLLEANLKANGCMNPILVWNNTIIDGHNRYEICTKHNIAFTTKEMTFSSKEEAKIWICDYQLGRRNLSDEAKKYLIGKRYEIEKVMASRRNPSGVNQYVNSEVIDSESQSDEAKKDTAQRLGDEYSISKSTVLKYGRYSRAIDHLAEIDPAIRPRILSGQCKVSHENIVEMSRMNDADIKEVSRKLQLPRKTYVPYSTSRQHIQEENSKVQLNPGIKQMPEFDPDSEITSIALTIPSWTNSIERFRSNADLAIVSSQAKGQLEEALLELQIAIEELLEDVERK